MKTSEVIQIINNNCGQEDVLILANGRIVRETLHLIDRERNFYMLLSMGHASSIGLGLAMSKPKLKIIIIDGDGNLLMNFGILAMIGKLKPKNLMHIVIDNSAYGTTGGQRTVSSRMLFRDVALSCGYVNALIAKSHQDFDKKFAKLYADKGPSLITAIVNTKYLDSPVFNLNPISIKKRFLSSITDKD